MGGWAGRLMPMSRHPCGALLIVMRGNPAAPPALGELVPELVLSKLVELPEVMRRNPARRVKIRYERLVV